MRVAEALGVEDADAALDRIGQEESIVLTLDSVDALAAIEPWLRQKFLPMLPAQGVVMMAGRHAAIRRLGGRPGVGTDLPRASAPQSVAGRESRAALRSTGARTSA